ncbi:MAG: ABC transporter permease [Armatimonadetes bacterium]|nr:ABC transporter permease [Armatimonadota bacterium]MDW8122573.1 FtsX-like permease family protein [Armatimonadota bacterium]
MAEAIKERASRGPTRGEIRKQIQLPLSEAFRISWRYVTIRLGRSLITAGTIFLSVAFLMSVFTMVAAAKAAGQELDQPTIARYTWLVTMGFLICGVGIVNALLMSVTERFREIGTMKCLGALDSFIVRMFLIEAGLMGLFAALTGGLAGLLLMSAWSAFRAGFSVLGKMDWGWTGQGGGYGLLAYYLLSVALGMILSVIAAIIPAWRAASLQAADALRTEI